MNPALMGLAIGLILGVVNFFILQGIAGRIQAQKTETSERSSKAVRLVAWIDILFFAVAGYFIGPMLLN